MPHGGDRSRETWHSIGAWKPLARGQALTDFRESKGQEGVKHVLEGMQQPIEDKVVTIGRAHGSLAFRANFMLVAAMNPRPRR